MYKHGLIIGVHIIGLHTYKLQSYKITQIFQYNNPVISNCISLVFQSKIFMTLNIIVGIVACNPKIFTLNNECM